MKTFEYTLRDQAGAPRKGTLQANDRSDALRQIKAMGGVPVCVTECQSFAASTRHTWKPSWNGWPLWLAASAALLIAALAVWRIVDRKPAIRAAPVTPNSSQKSTPYTAAPKTTKPASVQKTAPALPREPELPEAVETPPPEERKTAAAGKLPEQAPLAPPAPAPEAKPAKPLRPPTYKTTTEHLLSMAMSVPPGVPIPPLPIPKNLEADFANSLSNEIVIYNDDDAHTAHAKENVAVAKNQLLELVKQGRSVSEVLQEFQDKTNERIKVRRQAQQELNDLSKNGTPAEAKAYMEKINQSFKELGIDPVSLPSPRKMK